MRLFRFLRKLGFRYRSLTRHQAAEWLLERDIKVKVRPVIVVEP